MKAFIIHSKGNATVEDVPAPRPGPGEALVQVRACGICGSDLHAYLGHQPFFQYPEVPGHEVVGDVVEIVPRPGGPMRLSGRPVEDDLQAGDRVVLDPAMPCGVCYPCAHGRYNCCENMRVVGVHAPGAMSEYYCAPIECLHRVPDAMSDEQAALVEPLSIGVQANSRGGVTDTDTVLVIGAGTIGLCVTKVARSRGARVAVSDLSEARRAKALQMGADTALDPRQEDFTQKLEEFARATGPSVVIEAVGTPVTAVQALELVAASGRVVLLGLISDEIRIPGNIMVKKELDFRGSRLHGGTVPQAVELITREQVDVSDLLTHTGTLETAEDLLKLMDSQPDEILKAVITVRK